MTDPFVGKLTYVRVYSGRAESAPTLSTLPTVSASASAASSR